MRKLLIAIVLLLPVTLVSCGHGATVTTPKPPKSALQTISESLLVTAEAVGQLQTIVIHANEQHLISDQTTSAILGVTMKVSLAGKQATAVTAGLGQLGPLDKSKISAIINPIIQAIQESLASGLIPIKDDTTRNTVSLSLTAIQGALASIQVILTGAN